MTVWFTADLHLGHQNIITYVWDYRPVSMETIIDLIKEQP